MHYFQAVHDECRKAAIRGQRATLNRTQLYGHMSWLGPEAWLHQFFPPLADFEIKLLQADLLIHVPESFADFLSLSNGLILFGGAFAIYGRREEASFDPEIRVPYDIVPVNRYERPRGLPEQMLIVGGYRWSDGGYLAVDTDTGRTLASTRMIGRALFEWPSFEQMLRSEVMRLARMFDVDGRKRSPGESEFPWESG